MSIGIIAQIPDNYNITSPQVSDFIRYGNVPVSHYTGNLDFKVNLLEELQDVEEVIPINLVYNSSGFIPNKLNDFVGHNWFLQYGGVVTREVNGRPDDYYDPDTNIHQQGFIFARYLSNSTIYEKKDYKKYGSYNYVFNDGRQNVELLPDKFKFNINGISGSFYLGNSNQPVVSSNTNTNLKVDASRFNIQNKQQDVIPSRSEFSIIDEYGNKYYFGGEMEYLEVTYNLGSSNGRQEELRDQSNSQITAWYLREIEFISGKKIKFEYNKFKPVYDYIDKTSSFFMQSFGRRTNEAPTKDSYLWKDSNFDQGLFRSDFVFYQGYYTSDIDQTGGGFLDRYSEKSSAYVNQMNYSVTRKLLPSKISSDFFEIKFEYEKSLSDNKYVLDSYMLKNIKVTSGQDVIKELELKYIRKGDFVFLDKLNNIKQKNSYSFDYNFNHTPPIYPTKGIDYWGYWNGKSDTNNPLRPRFKFDFETGEYSILDDTKKENATLYDAFLLKKITYPTKGFTIVEYEGHTYSKRLVRNSSSQFLKALKSESGSIGGARVKKVSNYAKDGDLTEEVNYVYNVFNNSISSGILYHDFFNVDYFKYTLQGRNYASFSESVNNRTNISLDSHIVGYSDVSELKNGKLFKRYVFTDYQTTPDILSVNREETDRYRALSNIKPVLYTQNYFKYYIDKSQGRGLPKEIQEYNENKILVKSTTYNFIDVGEKVSNKNNYAAGVTDITFGSSIFFFDYMKYPYTSFVETERIEKIFSNNNSIQSILKSSYESNKHDFVTSKNTILQNGDNNLVKFKYTVDLSNYSVATPQVNSIEDEMAKRNMLRYPINTLYSRNGVVSKQDIYTYDLFNQNYYLKSQYSVNKNGPNDFFINKGNYQPDITNGIKNGIVNEEFSITNYGPLGQVYETKNKDGIINSYYYIEGAIRPSLKYIGKPYGYYGNYPAEATYNAYSDNDELFKENLKFLGTAEEDVLIEGYMYKNKIQIKGKVDVKGTGVYYKYDEANRLKLIKDDKGSVLQEYEYNYKNN